MENIFQENANNYNKSWVSISDKIDFKIKIVKIVKVLHCIMIKVSIFHENMTLVNMYSKLHKTELKREISSMNNMWEL